MKKVVSLKEIMIILISVMVITLSTTVFASDLVLGTTNEVTTLTGNEYDNAQVVETENTSTNNVTNNQKVNITGNNVAKTYNTNNSTDLPQTGIEDYNIGILLIIFVASAIFAYKKINDYKNI